jgi:hypothetical protein
MLGSRAIAQVESCAAPVDPRIGITRVRATSTTARASVHDIVAVIIEFELMSTALDGSSIRSRKNSGKFWQVLSQGSRSCIKSEHESVRRMAMRGAVFVDNEVISRLQHA